MKSSVIKRSIMIDGHKTSVSLEDAFWRGLKEIARGQQATLSNVVDVAAIFLPSSLVASANRSNKFSSRAFDKFPLKSPWHRRQWQPPAQSRPLDN